LHLAVEESALVKNAERERKPLLRIGPVRPGQDRKNRGARNFSFAEVGRSLATQNAEPAEAYGVIAGKVLVEGAKDDG
jgi:hypothetical protein